MIKFPIVCKKTKERSYTIEDYKKTKHFHELVKKYHNSKLPKKCFVCEKKESLTYIHKTYKNIGNEKPEDLVPVCFTHFFAAKENKYLFKGKDLSMWSVLQKIKKLYKEQRKPSNDFLWK